MTGRRLVHARLIRRLSLLLALLAGLGLPRLFDNPRTYAPGFAVAGSQDLVAYWSAARLLLRGADPYDSGDLLAKIQSAGSPWCEGARIWNPPWTLVLVLPLALLPFGLATQLWLVLQLGLILGSGLLLWRYFAPGDARYWIGLLLAAAFVPGLFALRMGQISSWLLLGLAVFLNAERSRRDLLAGSALALLMMKPHCTYLFWPAALWWAWRSQRWRVLMGWLASLTGASAVVLLLAPDVYANYVAAAVAVPPLQWATPTLGAWLRAFFGQELQWLQFMPSLLGALAVVLWLLRRRGSWQWEDLSAPLLLASAFTAAYGWSFDQIVLLPVVVAMVRRLCLDSPARRAVVLGVWVISQLGLVTQNLIRLPEFFYVWHPFVLAGLYQWSMSTDRVQAWSEAGRGGT